ncbi:MAG: restriction endonuclease [Planctomycetia bacterium]|nr:restriction endonuclease [Planctomycetia bacterium]
MLPLLEVIRDGNDHSNREIEASLTEKFGISDAELDEVLKSSASVFVNRVAWAKVHMRKAGLLDLPSRGMTRITAGGLAVLSQRPAKVNLRFLIQFPSYDWHKNSTSEQQVEEHAEEVRRTPEEQLEASYDSLREKLAADLLEKVRSCSAQFFERLVVRLLVAIGYGGTLADAGQAIGKAKDGGIDGIIKEDKLGLDFVCVQAKRWEGNVGRPVVQAFAGSMEGFRARKGVLITTSSFSRDALEFVKHIERKIVLIDGEALAQLMIDHDVGVSTHETYVLKRVDSDFFADDEA